MTLRRLIFRNAFRNKRRTGLTVLSIGFSLFLLISLATFLDLLLNPPMTEASSLRLAVRRSTSLTELLPIAYAEKLRKMPHVAAVTPLQWFNGIYQDPKNLFANFAVDPQAFFEMFPELKVSEETRSRFQREKRGCIAGDALARRFNWKVGDRIPLQGTIFPVDMDLILVGTYHFDLDPKNLYFRYDYMNEALGRPDTVGAFWLRADGPEAIPEIAEGVDAMFRNSAAETKTESEKAFVLGFVSMLGNVRMLIGSVCMVVVFTMMLVSASTMAMTIRERAREVAILKAIGFPARAIFFIILGEAVFIAVLGYALAGVLVLWLQNSDLYTMTGGFVQTFSPTPRIQAMALGVAVGLGVVSGLGPALQSSRMTIAEAMRRLE